MSTTIMRAVLKAFIFMTLLHLASGTQITSIQIFHNSLDVKVGQQLLIPCKFNLDEPLQEQTIELEWGMTPKEGKKFRPLIHLNGTKSLPVTSPNARAWMDLVKVQNGICSLVIDPVQQDDIGIYKIRLAISGKEYEKPPEVNVHIWKPRVPSIIQTFHQSLDAKVGHPLTIPCVFNANKPLGEHQIKLEWGMTPASGGEYRPLLRVSDTMPQPVPHPNPRARINPTQVNSGQCAMVISPAELEDSGTYKIHLAIDGEESNHTAQVKVHVWELQKVRDIPTSQPNEDHLLHSDDYQPDYHSIGPGVVPTANVFQNMKNNGSLSLLAIVIGLVILLHLVVPGPGTYFAVQHFLLKRKNKDVNEQMEEGGTSKDDSEVKKQEVSTGTSKGGQQS